jgi:hypothetical protein
MEMDALYKEDIKTKPNGTLAWKRWTCAMMKENLTKDRVFK